MTGNWQRQHFCTDAHKWLKFTIFSGLRKNVKNKCLKKNLHGSQTSRHKSCSMWPCHLDVGVCLNVMCYDYRGALTCLLCVTTPMSLSHVTFLPNTSVETLSEKKKPRGTAAMRANTELSHFKNLKCILSGELVLNPERKCCQSDSPKAPFAFVCPPKNIPLKIFPYRAITISKQVISNFQSRNGQKKITVYSFSYESICCKLNIFGF